jgi:RluA family pseudouridine synthase
MAAGQPEVALLDFLSARFTYHSRDQWRDRIAEQRVLVNTVAAVAERILVGGDEIEFIVHDIAEPPVSFDVRIVFEDYDVMVINKPANLPCHPAGRYFNHTLWAYLKTRHCLESPILVNRLDRETSGLVLVAKHMKAEAQCRAQFAQRRVVKRYIALVEAAFPETLQARGWMLPDPESGVHKRRRFMPSPSGSEPSSSSEWAETDFRRLSATADGVSEVEAILHTGRLHQIRATLSSLGYPVVGDKLYGPDPMIFVRFCTEALTDEDRRRLRMPRQALHATELEFQHPSTGERMRFEAPLPSDMAAVLGRESKQ